jgi:hypothetical protein
MSNRLSVRVRVADRKHAGRGKTGMARAAEDAGKTRTRASSMRVAWAANTSALSAALRPRPRPASSGHSPLFIVNKPGEARMARLDVENGNLLHKRSLLRQDSERGSLGVPWRLSGNADDGVEHHAEHDDTDAAEGQKVQSRQGLLPTALKVNRRSRRRDGTLFFRNPQWQP